MFDFETPLLPPSPNRNPTTYYMPFVSSVCRQALLAEH